jgi:hypothetical protein
MWKQIDATGQTDKYHNKLKDVYDFNDVKEGCIKSKHTPFQSFIK